jgi:hypothetical protein
MSRPLRLEFAGALYHITSRVKIQRGQVLNFACLPF